MYIYMWIYIILLIICILVFVLTKKRETFMLRDDDELMIKGTYVCSDIYDYSSVGY